MDFFTPLPVSILFDKEDDDKETPGKQEAEIADKDELDELDEEGELALLISVCFCFPVRFCLCSFSCCSSRLRLWSTEEELEEEKEMALIIPFWVFFSASGSFSCSVSRLRLWLAALVAPSQFYKKITTMQYLTNNTFGLVCTFDPPVI